MVISAFLDTYALSCAKSSSMSALAIVDSSRCGKSLQRWPHLENVAIRQSRVLADELYSMIHVSRLKDYGTR